MKLLFINAIDTTKPIQTRYPPLGIGHLVSRLRQRFPGVIEFRVVDRDIEQAIWKFRPDIVGISAVSQNFNRAISYATIAKEFGAKVICGGVHISMMPSSLMRAMDVGVIGEGEETICDLMALFMSTGAFEPVFLRDIPGIVFRDHWRFVRTKARPPITPIDALPPPARDLFASQPETYMFTSRGCPYRCAFCASTRFWKGVRSFSPEYIVAEVQRLVEAHGAKTICFYDDIFPLDIERVRTCVALLDAKGLLGKVEFTCSVRANLVSPEIVHTLKQMGVKSIGVGMESGTERILQYLKGSGAHVSYNASAIEMIRSAGLSVHGSFIIGSPDESMAEAAETLRFIERHRLSADLYMLTPFPGTPVWDQALARGLVSEGMDWDRLDVEYDRAREGAIILSEQMTKSEIDSLFARFIRERKKRQMRAMAREGFIHPRKAVAFLWRKAMRKEVRK
jgi:anaerobic magnesium-protoporphyrin IX monomethyl ester cyclase